MCVLDQSSGRIVLSDTCSLWANMPRKTLRARLEEFTGKACFADNQERATLLTTAAFSFWGGQAACLCTLRKGRLHTVQLHCIGGTAKEQRARLLGFLGVQDPCGEAMQSVLMRRPFGAAWIAADTRSGDMTLRITFTVKE